VFYRPSQLVEHHWYDWGENARLQEDCLTVCISAPPTSMPCTTFSA
jgi:hypothetical protein